MVTLNLPVVIAFPPYEWRVVKKFIEILNQLNPNDKIKGKSIGWDDNVDHIYIFYAGHMPKKSVINSLVNSAGLTLTKF